MILILKMDLSTNVKTKNLKLYQINSLVIEVQLVLDYKKMHFRRFEKNFF